MPNNILDLTGKHIVVVGATSGIGKKTAILLSQYGATLTLVSRREQKLEQTLSELDNTYKHCFFSLDITEYASLENMIETAVSKQGKIDGLLYSAGIDIIRPISSLSPENYESVFSTNVISAFTLAKIITKRKYLSQKGNSLVFISSIMGVLGQSAKVAYSSSKGAMIAGAKSMAIELAPKNIRVNCISPAVIETEMSLQWIDELSSSEKKHIVQQHPLGFGETEDVANACLFLLSDASKWITGTNLIVDGGYSAI